MDPELLELDDELLELDDELPELEDELLLDPVDGTCDPPQAASANSVELTIIVFLIFIRPITHV